MKEGLRLFDFAFCRLPIAECRLLLPFALAFCLCFCLLALIPQNGDAEKTSPYIEFAANHAEGI